MGLVLAVLGIFWFGGASLFMLAFARASASGERRVLATVHFYDRSMPAPATPATSAVSVAVADVPPPAA